MSDSTPLVLDAEEQRVLGSLLEKQVTVPASYPLTVNALRTACNQTSSREPIADYDERSVELTAKRLRDKGLARIVWADTGRRTLKYHQTLDEALELGDDERALLTVLLLRGAQAPGELRARTDRLYAFADREAVQEVLGRLAGRGLVRELPRRGGDRDNRWVHLLGDQPEPESSGGSGSDVDRESVLSQGADERDAKVRTSYDAIAGHYADALTDELEALPFERWLLGRVAEHAGADPVVEVGCGPGHVTAYLAAADVDATGIDLSSQMVEQARLFFPDGRYEVGDLRQLVRPGGAAGWSAVLGWYALIHLAASELPSAVAALARPLAPGGWLVLAMHAGSEVRHLSSWFETPVDLDVVMHDPAGVVAVVEAAGLVDTEWYVRGPVITRGETTDRLYVVARAPS